MTVQHALEILHGETREEALYQYDREDRPYILARAERMAIQSLEELEQYRALGTVEELKEAREKQIPQKPTDIDEDVNTFVCPSCGHTLIALDDMTVHQHCLICGQALKWGEEDD